VAGLASETLSFEGDVTVTEQMSRAALGGEPRRDTGGRGDRE
jgi:hypothetical protein